MAFYIKNPKGYTARIYGVEVDVLLPDLGPFATVEDAVEYWIKHSGGIVTGASPAVTVYSAIAEPLSPMVGDYQRRQRAEKAKREMSDNEVEYDDVEPAEPLNETKAERFRRVGGPRVQAAVKRLRMIKQMVEGGNANNYDFTDEQRKALVAGLRAEIDEIDRLMVRKLTAEDDDFIPSFI